MSELENRNEQLIADFDEKAKELQQKIGQKMNEDLRVYLNWVVKVDKYIKKVIPEENERKKCFLYHRIISSTPDQRVKFYDFEGDLSIEKMFAEYPK